MLSSTQEAQQIKARVLHTIKYGLEFDLSTEQCKQFLKRHVNSNAIMVILIIDINGSTQMSITHHQNLLQYYRYFRRKQDSQ